MLKMKWNKVIEQVLRRLNQEKNDIFAKKNNLLTKTD